MNSNVGGGRKMLNVIYPNENGANFGYNVANSTREISFTIGDSHSGWLSHETTLELKLALRSSATALAGSVDAVFEKVRILTESGVVLLEDQATIEFYRIQHVICRSAENINLQWEENLDSLMLNSAVVSARAKKYAMKFKNHTSNNIELFLY